jgi:RimJ/RimL family protein N-acetyltransferase
MFPDLARDDVFRLETRRLWLRWPRPQDVTCLAHEARDPLVAEKTLDVPHPYPEGAAAEFVLMARKANADGEKLVLVLAPKRRPAEAIGCVALRRSSETAANLRFWLGRQHWGQGLATEAVRGLVDLAFGLTELSEILASTPGLNPAALRVFAKAGFLPAGCEPIEARARGGVIMTERFMLDRHRWSREHGRHAADAQNAMSVLRA